ncbi:TadG family pilus assembly protein [Trichloromonas sp.]|uniref:TadG family pilus assembly protein n=1 Tax=Trichloromonas sp. TaxID=3069249 RepID=UPI003D814B86
MSKSSRSVTSINISTSLYYKFKQEGGAIAVIVAILILVLVGFAAFAIDFGHLAVVQKELQNAADAGALAGAQALYEDPDGAGSLKPGDAVNMVSNRIAAETAAQNKSEQLVVEITWAQNNNEDVQRGHWNPLTKAFTSSNSTQVVNLVGRTNEELYAMDGTDGNPPLINAVRVVTHREATPATSFLAGIFGFNSFVRQAEAIAYLGFTGIPFEVDLPIVLCSYSIQEININGVTISSCTTGRMINSGKGTGGFNTGGWTDLEGDSKTCHGTNTSDILDVFTGGKKNPCERDTNDPIMVKTSTLNTTGGQAEPVLDTIIDCWKAWLDANGNIPWTVRLPVVNCGEDKNVGNCPPVDGVATVEIVWITDQTDPQYKKAPTQMEDWPKVGETFANGEARWNSFTKHFNLKDYDSNGQEINAPYVKKSLYFKPRCELDIGKGGSGGSNFGNLTRRPVLVD